MVSTRKLTTLPGFGVAALLNILERSLSGRTNSVGMLTSCGQPEECLQSTAMKNEIIPAILLEKER